MLTPMAEEDSVRETDSINDTIDSPFKKKLFDY